MWNKLISEYKYKQLTWFLTESLNLHFCVILKQVSLGIRYRYLNETELD